MIHFNFLGSIFIFTAGRKQFGNAIGA